MSDDKDARIAELEEKLAAECNTALKSTIHDQRRELKRLNERVAELEREVAEERRYAIGKIKSVLVDQLGPAAAQDAVYVIDCNADLIQENRDMLQDLRLLWSSTMGDEPGPPPMSTAIEIVCEKFAALERERDALATELDGVKHFTLPDGEQIDLTNAAEVMDLVTKAGERDAQAAALEKAKLHLASQRDRSYTMSEGSGKTIVQEINWDEFFGDAEKILAAERKPLQEKIVSLEAELALYKPSQSIETGGTR